MKLSNIIKRKRNALFPKKSVDDRTKSNGKGSKKNETAPNTENKRRSESSSIRSSIRSSLSTRRSFLMNIKTRRAKAATADLVDLADEDIAKRSVPASVQISKGHSEHTYTVVGTEKMSTDFESSDPIQAIRRNLPPDPLLYTPFGEIRCCYADYTASGRSLHVIEEYLSRVIAPMYANTHTETSATGLQTTHAREEARLLIMKSLNADPKEYDLIFTGTGSTGAIWKLIAILGIHCPPQLCPHLNKDALPKVLVLVSHCEHHSNEIMWRQTIADVIAVPSDEAGELDKADLRQILEEKHQSYDLIIGSFTAGSNVTGLRTHPGPVAKIMHEFGGFVCFDYAGAGPYVDMQMQDILLEDECDYETSYLDAVYISPHKFPGGPGTPGILCIKKDFADCTKAKSNPPTIAGGGTVTMVWPCDSEKHADTNAKWEDALHAREEAGTPGIIDSVRCGLVFHIKDLVGSKRIEEIESKYAQEAVIRLQKKGIWIMGDRFSNITSRFRLSITSFNVRCRPNGEDIKNPHTGKPLLLHFNFVSALLNDLYGIQSRGGCSCAGPLGFRLFEPEYGMLNQEHLGSLIKMADGGFHGVKPGWCRVNFNYFLPESEFDYILSAIEQIAEHGWKLLPLYAFCLKTGQYWYNGVTEDESGELTSFNRFDAVRSLKEVQLDKDGNFIWKETNKCKQDRKGYLDHAMEIYDKAPDLVRKMLFRFRDLRRKDVEFPSHFQGYRWCALGSEILPHLGITTEEVDENRHSHQASSRDLNPIITGPMQHNVANPMLTFGRPRG